MDGFLSHIFLHIFWICNLSVGVFNLGGERHMQRTTFTWREEYTILYSKHIGYIIV